MRQENIRDFLQEALQLASQGLGVTSSNPSVGCIVVGEDGNIVGRGRTSNGGRPHAEYNALRQAGDLARGADVFVTLEPCCHHGVSGACTERIIESEVRRVYILCEDIDPRVRGRGVASLRDAGIEVVELWKEEWTREMVWDAKRMKAGYALHRTTSRPLVAMKVATSLDGKMGLKGQGRVWITGDKARNDGQWLRGRYDAILVGRKTVMLDDPKLDCRIGGEEWRSPIPIVLDPKAKIAQDEYNILSPNLILVVGEQVDKDRVKRLKTLGVHIIRLEATQGRFKWQDILSELASRGITRLLVEGGSDIYQDLLSGKYLDRIYWYRNSSIIGDDCGTTICRGTGELKRWEVIKRRVWGNDDMIVLEDGRLNDSIAKVWDC